MAAPTLFRLDKSRFVTYFSGRVNISRHLQLTLHVNRLAAQPALRE